MNYKVFDQDDFNFLISVCGAERVTARDDIGEDYCHDECDVVVPRSKVAEFVIFSHELQGRLRSEARPQSAQGRQ